MPPQSPSSRPRSAPAARPVAGQRQGVAVPLNHFAIRAQLRKRYGTAHAAWKAVARQSPEVDRETLYVGLYRAGIMIPDQSQFEALWAYCDPEGVGMLSYRNFCAAFAGSDASVSLHRRTPPPSSMSVQHGAVLRSGVRVRHPADTSKRCPDGSKSPVPPRRSAEGQYLGTSLEACIHDEADCNNGTHLTLEALSRALQRARLNLGEEALTKVWDRCLAAPDLHAVVEPGSTTGVQEPFPHFMRDSGRPREPFPNTGRGTLDTCCSLPLAGGLPTRAGRRGLTSGIHLESCCADVSAVSCATAIRVLRAFMARDLEVHGWRAWRASCMSVPVDTQRPAQEYEVHNVVSSWRFRSGSGQPALLKESARQDFAKSEDVL